MKKKLLSVFFAFVFLPFFAPSALAVDSGCNEGNYTKANTTYLSPSAGESNQTQINSAIAAAPVGGSVFLKKGIYIISQPIKLKSDIILEGDKEAVVQLKDHANWKTITYSTAGNTMDPIIGGNTGLQNIEIKCFTIDGNYNFRSGSGGGNYNPAFYSCIGGGKGWNKDMRPCEAKFPDRYHGQGYYTLIGLSNGGNWSIHDLTMKDGCNDGVKIDHANGVRFYNNDVNAMGHEGLYAIISHGIEVYGNKIAIRASDGVRGDNCYDMSIHDNEMFSYNKRDSSAGVQIAEKAGRQAVYNIQIFRNAFLNIWRSGVWFSVGAIAMKDGKYPVEIHHNLFVGNGLSNDSGVGATGGITSDAGANVITYNNTFEGNLGSGILDAGSKMKVINNIIVGTKANPKYSGGGSGIGVQGGSEVSYNVFYQNVSDYAKSGTGNFNADPLFYKSGSDYHVLSQAGRWDPALGQWVSDSQSSRAIDAGIPLSVDSVYGEYKNEQENNGDRVNAGVYGNTSQASLTGSVRQATMPPAPVTDVFSTVDFSSGGGDATGGGGATGGSTYIPGTGTGGTGLGAYDNLDIIEEMETMDYYDPGMAVTPAIFDYDVPVAALPAVGILAPLFPQLGVSAPTATAACSVGTEGGGLVPCGRNTDNPDTAWNECDACDLCAFILMGQLTIEFLMEITGVLAVLFIIYAGFLYIFAVGKANMISKAKLMIKYILIGFVIVFTAWIVVNSILMIFGYIDPIGGTWHTVC